MDDTITRAIRAIIREEIAAIAPERVKTYVTASSGAGVCPQFEAKTLPPILSPAQLAEALDVSVRTLDMWRANGSGPTPRNPDGTRFYRYYAADVLAWLENKKPVGAAPGSRTAD